MGQFWDRVKRIARSQSAQHSASSFEQLIDDEDDELRKAIDAAAYQSSAAHENKAKRNVSNQRKQTELQKSFAVLGLPTTATNEEVKAAYRILMKEFHPDAVAKENSKVQDIAKKRSQEINMAYQYIKKIRKF